MAQHQWAKWHKIVVQRKESVEDLDTWKEEGIKGGKRRKGREECRKFEREKRERKERGRREKEEEKKKRKFL